MPNGKVFDELREMADDGRDIPQKSMLRLIMAALADMHDADVAYRTDISARMKAVEEKVKYPSALWYLVNMPLKTLGLFALIGLIMTLMFVPEARAWAGEQIIKTVLGGL